MYIENINYSIKWNISVKQICSKCFIIYYGISFPNFIFIYYLLVTVYIERFDKLNMEILVYINKFIYLIHKF